jgi:hypothetical protein
MSNLLPVHTVQALNQLYKHRLIAIASTFLLIIGIGAGIILLPSYMIVKKNQMSTGSNVKLSTLTASAEDRALITHIQSRMNVLSPFADATSTPSILIKTVLADRPSGVSVNHITFTSGKTFTIVLTGVSVSPDKIGTYQASLTQDHHFSNVSVPIGALAGTNDGSFTITVVGTY